MKETNIQKRNNLKTYKGPFTNTSKYAYLNKEENMQEALV